MVKRMLPVALLVVLMISIMITCYAEETHMEEIIIPSPNGHVYGVFQLPDGETPVPLIILSHGFGGNHTLDLDSAAHFAGAGFATYNLDFCGGGVNSKSSGTMLDMSVLTEAADLNAVIDHFREDERISDIFLWGASQGGFVSAYVSSRRPEDIRAVVLEFPAIVLQDDAEKRRQPDGSFPETSSIMGLRISRKYDEDATSFDLYDLLPAYTGPVLVLHGDKDPVVPLRYSEKAVETYADARLVVYPGQGHGFAGAAKKDALEQETAFFLEAEK